MLISSFVPLSSEKMHGMTAVSQNALSLCGLENIRPPYVSSTENGAFCLLDEKLSERLEGRFALNLVSAPRDLGRELNLFLFLIYFF